MKKLVRKTLADSPMTPARKRTLSQLAKRPDSEIDFSDIPPLKESFRLAAGALRPAPAADESRNPAVLPP